MGGIALCATALLLAMPGSAWAVSSQTDVLLLVDTSGSMEGALSSAVSDVNEISDRVRGELGDVQFGVAEVRDYPLSIFGNAGSGNVPYRVVQPITGDKGRVSSALFGLSASGGGDLPEAYPRALRDADNGSGGLGWRPGARRLVILVADDMPHDNDLNWGIPSSVQISSSPYSTIADPGNDEIVGNGDDIDWQSELGQLAEHGLPLMFVLFEGEEKYLPYWQIWAGWTGGAAATADTGNLANIVVELARRGATAKLPYCPPGQSRDEARRCRPYWEWLGYAFKNARLPQEWASPNGFGRDEILTGDVIDRTFADLRLPSWWAFWRHDPRGELWAGTAGGVCYGMALSGGRFSTGLDPQTSPSEGRASPDWGAARTPLLQGPLTDPDLNYRRELMQTIAASHISQFSFESYDSRMEQSEYFGEQAAAGTAAGAERGQLESIMSTGHGQVGSSGLASERPLGIAMVAIRDNGEGHALVAYDVRETGGGAFQMEVWDNNRPLQISSITVNADGSWSYPPLGWSGPAGTMTFLPEYPPHDLHYRAPSTPNGTGAIADVPADVNDLKASAATDSGASAPVSMQPEITGLGDAGTIGVVTNGSELHLSLSGKQVHADARGGGNFVIAEGLTGDGGGTATIDYQPETGQVSAESPRTGTLEVIRGARSVAATGAAGLRMGGGGGATATVTHGGTVSLVFASAAHGPLASTMLTLRVPKHGVVRVRGATAKGAIRHGGAVAVTVRSGRNREVVRVPAHSVAGQYRLRAHLQLKRHVAKLRLSASRRMPRSAEGRVVWLLERHGKTVERRLVSLRHPRTHRVLARLRLPRHLHGLTVKAIARVVVSKPGPAELVAVDSHRIRRSRKHPHGHGGHQKGGRHSGGRHHGHHKRSASR